MHSTQLAYLRLLRGDVDLNSVAKVSLVFDVAPVKPGSGELSIWLGQPIIEWSTRKLGDEVFHARAFECLASWISLEQQNAFTRPLGYIATVGEWKSGEPLKERFGFSIVQTPGNPANRIESTKRAVPPLRALLMDLLTTGDDEDVKWVRSLITQMRKLDADLDPQDHLWNKRQQLRSHGAKFCNAKERSDAKKGAEDDRSRGGNAQV